MTKDSMRGSRVDALLAKREEDVDWFTKFILQEGTQKGIKAYLETLGSKRKK